jgi:two-component system KDP operon response regulator KdpE
MMNKKPTRLLIIDDEPAVCRFLRLGLEPLGYQIEEAGSGNEGIAKSAAFNPELILLDLGLPDMGGLEVLQSLREWTKVPILVLTVRDSEQDKVSLLDAGADDYLTKPFGLPELSSRIKVALRHRLAEFESTPILKTGRLEIDFPMRAVKLDGAPVKLTVTEYDVLRLLALARGQIVTQQQLLNEVWGTSENSHYLRIYIRALRKKLEAVPANPTFVMTEPGVGYRLNVNPAAPL